jgi:tetratricopeptide (TPR) repeat protein
VGVTILFAALVLLLLPLIRALRSREIPEENSRLLFALLFALGALFLDAGVDHPLTKTAPLLLLALLAAGLARLSAEPERTRTIRVSSPFRGKSLILLVLLASGAVLFLLSGWIVSDYFRAGARKVARHSYTEAVVKIEKSLKINQTSYLSHFLHGNYLSSLGKAGRDPQLLAKSLPAYRQAVKLYPTFYPAFLNQGQVLLWLELPLESRKALEGALALQPYQPEANFLLSAILLGLGETGEARRRFQLALSFRPRLREEFRDDPKFKPLFSDPAVIESEKER